MTLRKWAAGIAAFVLLAVVAAPAHATTYYVNGSYATGPGNRTFQQILADRDARAGTSSALAWGTLAHANATVATGDVVILERCLGANYLGNIDPACTATAGAFVTYEGDILNPEYATVTGGAISTPYVSIKGVAFTGGLTLSGDRDSLQYCTVAGPFNVEVGAKYCYVGSNHFNGYAFQVDGCHPLADTPYTCSVAGPFSRGNVFDSNHFTNLFGSALSGGNNSFSVIGADSTNFLFNTFDINGELAGNPTMYFVVKHARRVNFRGCRWNFNSFHGEGGRNTICAIRDSVTYLSFDCDTFSQVGPGKVQFRLCGEGNNFAVGGARGNVNHVSIDSSLIHLKGSDDGLWAQEQINQLTITRSVIINENGPALTSRTGAVGPNLIDHNTFVGAVEPYSQAIFGMDEGSWQDSTIVTNNIFYSIPPVKGERPPLILPHKTAAAVMYSAQSYDSTFYATLSTHARHLRSAYNLFAYYGPWSAEARLDTVAKMSIGWRVPNTSNFFNWPGRHPQLRAPSTYAQTLTFHPVTRAGVFYNGDTTYAVTQTFTDGWFIPDTLWSIKWCPGCDAASRYGSPMFADSSGATFNPSLTAGSRAIAGGVAGTDIGAIAYVDPPRLTLGQEQYSMHVASDQAMVGDSVFITNNSSTTALTLTSVTATMTTPLVGTLSVATSKTIDAGVTDYLTVRFTPDWRLATPPITVAYGYLTATTNDPLKPTVSIPIYITNYSRELIDN